jgi:tetratricopeptide (TPR) repeat protein
VQEARDSGDAQAVSQSSRALIALGLRQVAHLRLVEDAFPAAIDLYKRSLDFEDNPSTRVDLAITDLRARKFDDSLTEVRSAILKDAEDFRAWRVQGMTYMSKGQYALAADSLQRSLAIHGDLEAAYSLGICFLAVHDKEKAAAVFQKMDEEAADRGALHVLMARAYRDAGSLDDAVRELQIALHLNPKTLHAHYLLGLVYLLQEEWAPKPKIREQFLLELHLNPRDFLSNYLLGAMASNERNFAESDKYLKTATEIQPNWSEPWLYLGLNANNQGDTKTAETFLRQAITLNGPDDSRSNFFIRKAYFALGRILSQSDRKAEARTYLQKARELEERVQADSVTNSPQAGGMGGTGDALIATTALKNAEDNSSPELSDRDSTALLDAAALSRTNLTEEEKAAALDQEKRLRAVLGAAFNDLATSEAMRQRYDLALADYQEAERWDANSPSLIRNLGVTAMKAGNYAEAVRALSQTLSADLKDSKARAMLGMSYYMNSQYKEAAQTISPLGDAALQDPGLGYAWADSLVKQQDLQAADDVLDKLERTPLSLDTLMLVGPLWEETGNHLRAVASYHRALEISPTQPRAHYFAGVAYIRADRPADAVPEFQAELALTPDDADAKYNLGFAYLQLSRHDEAESLFKGVAASHPEHADAQYQLGKMLLDEGKVKEAISHLETAVRLRPQSDYMHYQLQAAYRLDSRIQDADRELALYKEIKANKRDQQAQGMGRD